MTKENWKEQFDANFSLHEYGDSFIACAGYGEHKDRFCDHIKVKNFISNLLTSQLQDILLEVEEMNKDTHMNGKTPLMYVNKGYNMCLSDIQVIIKNRMENI